MLPAAAHRPASASGDEPQFELARSDKGTPTGFPNPGSLGFESGWDGCAGWMGSGVVKDVEQ